MASQAHFYLNWAKERIDEMDAVLASLDERVSQLNTQARSAAEKAIGELRSKRDAFFNEVKKQTEGGGEAAWERTKEKLEAQWGIFQGEVGRHFEGIVQQGKQQQAAFEQIAGAQLRSWREAAENIRAATAGIAADQRAKVEATTQQMKAEASAAEAKFEKLAKAGTESWTAWSAALTESRTAFDRANQVAWESFKRASSAA
jgi:ElaB/YqjD/DUF883 family membrane-anchored ribosome-binding protein